MLCTVEQNLTAAGEPAPLRIQGLSHSSGDSLTERLRHAVLNASASAVEERRRGRRVRERREVGQGGSDDTTQRQHGGAMRPYPFPMAVKWKVLGVCDGIVVRAMCM